MKKLMVAVAAVATAFGLYADGLKKTTGFETLAEGSTLDITKADDGTDPGEGSGPLWYAAGADPETGTITAYGETAKYDYTEGDKLVTDGPGKQFLALDSSETIYRTAVEVKGPTPTAQAIGDGAFFDTLVKFTVTDGLAVPQLDAGAKVAVWAGTDDSADDAPTNLFVTAAGFADDIFTPTAANFAINVGDDFDFAAWHRVTLRAIADVTASSKIAGFALFIDGVQVAVADVEGYKAAIGAKMEEALVNEAKKFYAEGKLFISLVAGGTDDAQTFVGMGFKGNGSVDDVAITDKANAPAFAKGSKMFTIAWTDGVTGFTLTDSAGGVTTKSDLKGADSEILTIDTAITSFTVSGVTHAADYSLDPLTFNGDEIEGNVFTLVGEADAGSINASIKYFEVNGKQYASIADAFAAAAGGTVSLIKDYAMGEDDTEITIDNAVVFDLQGNDLTLGDYADEDIFLVNEGAALTIIDSVGCGAIDGTDLTSIIYSEGEVNIGLDNGDEGATFTGKLLEGNDPVIVKGNFDKANNGEDEFAYFDLIDDDHEVVDTVMDGYWTVRVKQAENVAEIDGVGYATLDEALKAAAAADATKTVVLLKDVTEDVAFEMAATRPVKLDLDGHTLTGDVTVTAPKNATAVFTVLSPVAKPGTIVGDIEVTNGKITISKSTKQDVTVEGAIVLNNVADATIQGTVENVGGTAITLNGGLLKITNTAAINAETAIDAKAGTVQVSSNSSSGAKASISGAVTVEPGVETAIKGGEFDSNISDLVAEGYKAVQQDDKWVVVKKDFYDITFKVEGLADYVTNVVEGTEVATVKPADPVVEGKTFKGWDPALEGVVESNATYTAILEEVAYPPEWPDADPTIAAKFAEWRANAGKDADLATDAAKNAFLLNCSVDDVTDLKIESIIVNADGTVTVMISAPGKFGFSGPDLRAINGVLFAEAGDTLDTMKPKAFTPMWTTETGKVAVSIKANFIKAVIGFKAPPAE